MIGENLMISGRVPKIIEILIFEVLSCSLGLSFTSHGYFWLSRYRGALNEEALLFAQYLRNWNYQIFLRHSSISLKTSFL